MIAVKTVGGVIEPGEVRAVLIDSVSGAVRTIAHDHHELHDGDAYHISDVQQVDTTTLKWMLTTPDVTEWVHMVFGIECTGDILVTITEGADRTGTTALTAINRNRNSSNTAGLVVHRAYSAGSTDGATTIYSKRTGVSGAIPTQSNAIGGSRGTTEFILKQNTKYVVSVTTTDTEQVSFELDWYEHTSID